MAERSDRNGSLRNSAFPHMTAGIATVASRHRPRWRVDCLNPLRPQYVAVKSQAGRRVDRRVLVGYRPGAAGSSDGFLGGNHKGEGEPVNGVNYSG